MFSRCGTGGAPRMVHGGTGRASRMVHGGTARASILTYLRAFACIRGGNVFLSLRSTTSLGQDFPSDDCPEPVRYFPYLACPECPAITRRGFVLAR